MIRTTLKSSYLNYSLVFADIDRLADAFFKQHKKHSKISLSYCEAGTKTKPIYELVAYSEKEDVQELAWFQSNV